MMTPDSLLAHNSRSVDREGVRSYVRHNFCWVSILLVLQILLLLLSIINDLSTVNIRDKILELYIMN